MEVKLSKQQKVAIYGSNDVYLIMRQILRRENKIGQGQEHFWMVGLNSMHKILYIELAALGSSNMANIKAREAFRLAIHKLAFEVILVHNHPNGLAEPSVADKDFTDYYIQAGRFLKVEVADHLILGEDDYFSFADSGLLDELKQSRKYELPDMIEARAAAKAKQEKTAEIAKALKDKEMSVDIIADVLGLSIQEIEQL